MNVLWCDISQINAYLEKPDSEIRFKSNVAITCDTWITLAVLSTHLGYCTGRLSSFDFKVSVVFQVDPKKHRLLFEVFDENRLVS